jgi:hypothetical protein
MSAAMMTLSMPHPVLTATHGGTDAPLGVIVGTSLRRAVGGGVRADTNEQYVHPVRMNELSAQADPVTGACAGAAR